MKRFTLQTSTRNEMLDILADVQDALDSLLSDAEGASGAALVYCPHTTAAITVNENYDPDVKVDMLAKLSREIPKEDGYHHAEGNSDSHLKSSLVGTSELVPVENGRIALGRWQGLLFCEFDGPRQREVWVSFLRS